MIDLCKAIEEIKNKYPDLEIVSTGRIEKGWIFSLGNKEGKKLRIAPIFVSEENGSMEIFFPPEHQEELQNYQVIE